MNIISIGLTENLIVGGSDAASEQLEIAGKLGHLRRRSARLESHCVWHNLSRNLEKILGHATRSGLWETAHTSE